MSEILTPGRKDAGARSFFIPAYTRFGSKTNDIVSQARRAKPARSAQLLKYRYFTFLARSL
ncbi:MAG: hypothetical protein JSS81_15010 [Acidobacteria bacterium]|nr:hypothetical protein [Acidobacteriota bacterium]